MGPLKEQRTTAITFGGYSLFGNDTGCAAEGHAEVVRELVVPVIRVDRVVAIPGVGNKPVEY